MLEYRDIYAGGRLVPSASGDVVTVVNPATEEIVGSAPACGAEDVDLVVRAACSAFEDGPWTRLSRDGRADALERLAAALGERSEEIARLVTDEMGMPIVSSRRYNVALPARVLRYYAGLARRLEPEETRPAVGFAGHTTVRREPVGVVAVIAPWNYPILHACVTLGPALAAGCTVVLRPAPETSVSGYALAAVAEAAGLPPGVLNVVTGGRDTAEALVRHAGVDRVTFSGDGVAGRRIAALCGETLKPATLEVGGGAAAIVLDDADLGIATAELGRLAFGNAGQNCFAMSRVLAPRSRYDDLIEGLAAQASALVVGDPLAETTTLGPLVSPRRRARVEAYVAAAVAAGARPVTGGRRPARPVRGYFYEPTVFADATNAARDPVFGPVVAVIPYRDEAEAVAIANDSAYGLAGTVWTAEPERGLDIARRVRVGTFGVNGYEPDLGAPWGGVKASGLGRGYGPEAIDTYLSPKSIFLPCPETRG